MLRIKPLPGYGNSGPLKALQKVLSKNAYGDGLSVAVETEREFSEREMGEAETFGQPFTLDLSQL
ncbi:MAG: hypothetical protein WC397_01165 [Candidatus Paceibacterota bacterium]|jgi:hypothetical protein